MYIQAGMKMREQHKKAISLSCQTKKPIEAQNLKTQKKMLFQSMTAASDQLKIDRTVISNVINGHQKSAGGWVFKREK